MIFCEKCLLAGNSHVISLLIFSKSTKDDAKFDICCSRDWRFKGKDGSVYIYVSLGHNLEFPYNDVFQSLKSFFLSWQTMKSLIKSHIMQLFIWVFTVYHYACLQVSCINS